MRKKKLVLNSSSSLIFQLILLLSGFILPRIIIGAFGSEINGLVNSITQYLSIVSFLELGIGAVVISALYEPLAEKNNILISQICVSAEKFFKTLARILLVYVIILIIVFPRITNSRYDAMFTGILIVSISINSFAQYYFGIVNQLLLTADQKIYIHNVVQSLTLILNLIISIILIKLNCSIQVVKLASSVVFVLRPIYLDIYVRKNYKIDNKITYDKEPIRQKWNGVAQHIAAIVLDSTDIIILSTFSSFANVSIYSVYRLVLNGMRTLIQMFNRGFHSLLGELWAKKEYDNVLNTFSWMEWLINTITTLIFGCCIVLVVPFVQVYTSGINDANYTQPTFAFIISIAFLLNCVSIPYHTMILAVGHYKETQHYFIISAILNLFLSIISVARFGLIGVAIGTLVAMAFQMGWMTIYVSKVILKRSYSIIVRFVVVEVVSIILGMSVCRWLFVFSVSSYLEWILLAMKVVAVWLIISVLMNGLFFNEKLRTIRKKIMRKNVNGAT